MEHGRAAQLRDGQLAGAVEGLGDPGSLRDSSVSWISRDHDTEWLFTRIEQVAERANRRWRLDVDGIEEDLQFTVYDTVGAHYTWHHDGLDAGVERRKLSLVVQLSDPRDHGGGRLEFLEVVEDYDDGMRAAHARRIGARGTVVAFPAYEYHRVTPLTWGVRHSLVAWLSGPPLR